MDYGLITTGDLACRYLSVAGILDNKDKDEWPFPPRIPKARPGFEVIAGKSWTAPDISVIAEPQCIVFGKDDIFFCHCVECPELLKPEIITKMWLHLHLCVLIAVRQGGIKMEALLASRIKPFIVGLANQPNDCFPLAYAALQWAERNAPLWCELPF